MTDSPHRRLDRLPPLLTPPSWANGKLPELPWFEEVHVAITLRHSEFQQARRLLSLQPFPSEGALREMHLDPSGAKALTTAFADMPYPANYTAWVDTARVLAEAALSEYERIITSLANLRALLPQSLLWQRELAASRRQATKGVEVLADLQGHTAQIIADLRTSEPVVRPSIRIVSFPRQR